jgi:hypothetical protein
MVRDVRRHLDDHRGDALRRDASDAGAGLGAEVMPEGEAMIPAIYLLPIVIGSLAFGHFLGRSGLMRSLTLSPDEKGVTGAHCLRGKFYYLVPESAWVRVAHWCPRATSPPR